MSRVLMITFILLPLLLVNVSADPFVLSLEDAVRLALDNSLDLKKSTIDLSQAGYSASRLWSEIFPGFSLSAGFTFLPSTPLLTDPGFKYRDDSLTYSLTFGLSLSLNPSLVSSMKRIDLAYRAQLLSYENACKQLEIQVIKNFLNLTTMKQNLVFLAERADLADSKLRNDRIARQNGLLNELGWLNSQLSAETARYNLVNAQGVFQNSLDDFLATLGLDVGTDINFQGTVNVTATPYDPEQLILEYLPKRPDIISRRQTVERLELTKNVTTLSSRSPSLNLSSQWRGTPESGGGLSGSLTDSVTGSVTLNIPIDSWIPGTRQAQSVRAANAEVEKARLDLQSAENSAKTQIRTIISNLNNSWESLSIARLRVDIASRTVDATSVAFRNGVVDFQELEDRRNDLSDARQRLLQGEFSYQSLLLDLAAALNVDWRSLTGQ